MRDLLLTEEPRRPYSDAVDFSVLGPLRVEGPDGAIEIRGAKERLLLARLVAARGRMVTASELIDTLWGEEPPASAAKSLQTFVLRLRNALEPDRAGSPTVLLTEGPGYRLALDQFSFGKQVQTACDTAKAAAARVTGKEAPARAEGPAPWARLWGSPGTRAARPDLTLRATFDARRWPLDRLILPAGRGADLGALGIRKAARPVG